MSLLQEIQDGAAKGTKDLATLLRLLQVLGARVGSEPVEDWVKWELNGYPPEAPLPDYRRIPVQVIASFSGSFGRILTNAAVPPSCIPKEFREDIESFHCRESVSAIEALTANEDSGMLHIPLGDLSRVLGGNVFQDMYCYQASGRISSAAMVNILSSVRNRVLDLALALWKKVPDLGEIPATPANTAMVTQVFNTTVNGGMVNVVGPGRDANLSFTVNQGDFSSLKRVLIENGISEKDVDDLKAALDAEPIAENGRFGRSVSAWVSGMMAKAADGSWQVALGAAGNLLATALGKYYGTA